MRMIVDCLKDTTDVVTLVSADADLIPPIEFIINHYKEKKVRVYFPPANHSFGIRDFMRSHQLDVVRLESNAKKFQNAVLPDIVELNGRIYTIPEKWKVTAFEKEK